MSPEFWRLQPVPLEVTQGDWEATRQVHERPQCEAWCTLPLSCGHWPSETQAYILDFVPGTAKECTCWRVALLTTRALEHATQAQEQMPCHRPSTPKISLQNLLKANPQFHSWKGDSIIQKPFLPSRHLKSVRGSLKTLKFAELNAAQNDQGTCSRSCG